MNEAKWVRPEERCVHLRVVFSIVFGEQLKNARVKPETIGVTLGDIAALAKLVWPSGNWWWSEFLELVPNQLCPILLRQYRAGFLIVQTHNIFVVDNANFETWLKDQARHFGGEWIRIAPA